MTNEKAKLAEGPVQSYISHNKKYPPFDLMKIDKELYKFPPDYEYALVFALAGFEKNELYITHKGNNLSVSVDTYNTKKHRKDTNRGIEEFSEDYGNEYVPTYTGTRELHTDYLTEEEDQKTLRGEYIQQGISRKNFLIEFTMQDGVEYKKVEFINGELRILFNAPEPDISKEIVHRLKIE